MDEKMWTSDSLFRVAMMYSALRFILLRSKVSDRITAPKGRIEGDEDTRYSQYLSFEAYCWNKVFYDKAEGAPSKDGWLNKIEISLYQLRNYSLGGRLLPYFYRDLCDRGLAETVAEEIGRAYCKVPDMTNKKLAKKMREVRETFEACLVPNSQLQKWAREIKKILPKPHASSANRLHPPTMTGELAISVGQAEATPESGDDSKKKDKDKKDGSGDSKKKGKGKKKGKEKDADGNGDRKIDPDMSNALKESEKRGYMKSGWDRDQLDKMARMVSASRRILQRWSTTKKQKDMYHGVFAKVKVDEAIEREDKGLADERVVTALRKVVLRKALVQKHHQQGELLDTRKYISYKMGKSDGNVFKTLALGKGARVIFLGDVSGSMSKYLHLEKVVYGTLKKAFKGYVEFEQYFFDLEGHRTVRIMRTVPAGHGMTPILAATNYVFNRTRYDNYTRNVIVVFTDLGENVAGDKLAQIKMLKAKEKKCRTTVIFAVPPDTLERKKGLFKDFLITNISTSEGKFLYDMVKLLKAIRAV